MDIGAFVQAAASNELGTGSVANPTNIEDLIDPALLGPGGEAGNVHPQGPLAEPAQPHGRRRRHSEIDGDDAEEQQLRRLRFAEGVIERQHIEGEAQHTIRQFAQLELPEMLIEIRASIAKKDTDVSSTAAKTFLASDVYKKHVVNRMKVALLMPRLLSYISLPQEWILNHMAANHEEWQIPEEIINDATQWSELSSHIKVKFTQIRSGWKILLNKLHQAESDINTIMRKLCPSQMDSLVPVFDGLCQDRTETAADFWEYVGRKLAEIKLQVAGNPSSTSHEARQRIMRSVFEHVLVAHRNQHPAVTSAGPLGDRLPWQASLETAMGLGDAV